MGDVCGVSDDPMKQRPLDPLNMRLYAGKTGIQGGNVLRGPIVEKVEAFYAQQ